MPIEIRELVIRAVIDAGGKKGGGGSTTGQGNAPAQAAGGGGGGESQDHLVDLCVEKVMELLKEKRER